MTAEDRKIEISNSLKSFASGNLTSNALKFFETLGYITDRQAPLHIPTFEEFKETYIDGRKFDETKAKVEEWEYVDLLFQLSEYEVLNQTSLFDTKRVNNTIIETYLFFVIELRKEQYTRTELSFITREVNRLFPMPVMILFKYSNTLTLSVINRRLHKKDENKDVLEKVTLIKDINIENIHRAHIEILYDLSFDELNDKHKFTNFVELHNAWQKTLDIKELNKKFFIELTNWYFWAMDIVQFPDDLEKKREKRNSTNLIRLITRIIFIWFIKEKKLVPTNLFRIDFLNKTIKDFSKDKKSANYYPAILQNLFFGTLNQEINKREFVEDHKGFVKKDQGVRNIYRFPEKFFINEDEIKKLFKDIPFLNGGLFDCLDKTNEETQKDTFVDGFTRRADKQTNVPDFLFFDEKHVIDLNAIYGTKNKKHEVQGLVNLLESYKFTVAENTPLEEEIALDPELLGKVFENLLASYNPETQTTARKQTGSFYTPREIVNYMVDESLLEYLKQKFNEIDTYTVPENEKRLRDLLSYSENTVQFDERETQQLIEAINNCKILDPACGSGAFPMGVLHKLVHVLTKLDPDNSKWKAQQKEKVIGEQIKELEKDKKAILCLSDKAVREKAEKAVEERLKEIDSIFESENNFDDYSRKLFLIESCIYGIDIQPIAVQISKLRFFISLIIDQNMHKGEINFGIRSLPNLETKFVAANTLIGLEIPTNDLFSENDPIKPLQDELKKIRHLYFSASSRKEKLQFQIRDKQLRKAMSETIKTLLVKKNDDVIFQILADIEIAQLVLRKIEKEPEQVEIIETINLFGEKEHKKINKKQERIKLQNEIIKLLENKLKINQNTFNKDTVLQVAENIASFDPYDQNDFAKWFEPEWMFGKELEAGFDIVIGNPPYIDIKGLPKDEVKLYFKIFNTTENRINLYSIFIEKGISLLNQDGDLVFINPNSILINESYKKIRKHIVDGVERIIKLPDSVFEAATVETIILMSKKKSLNKNILGLYFAKDDKIDFTNLFFNSFARDEWKNDIDSRFNIFGDLKVTSLLKKINSQSITLDKFVFTSLGITPYDKYKGHSIDLINNREFHSYTKLTNQYVPLISGKNIHPFYISDEIEEYIKYGDWLGAPRDKKFFINPKIIVRQIVSGNELKIVAGYSDTPHYFTQIGFSLISKTDDKDKLKFILGLLNSSLINFYHRNKFLDIEKVVFQKILIANCKQLPVKEPNDLTNFITLVDKIRSAKTENPKVNTIHLEKQLDEMVYQLYDLTEEEIKIVEGN